MISNAIPVANYKEIERRDKHVFFVRFDATVKDEVVECTEMAVFVDGLATYQKLVAATITGRYDYDAQIAILANKDDGDPDHARVFAEFQAWRTEAKRLARIMFPEEVNNDAE